MDADPDMGVNMDIGVWLQTQTLGCRYESGDRF